MRTIQSFTINHLKLKEGLYVSRKDEKDGTTVTTFDLRMTRPNIEPVMDIPAMHTIEHLGATYLRNSERAEDVIYFGPMGCRTGFYLVMFGDLEPDDVYQLVCDMCEYITQFVGGIPGASASECGNYLSHDLNEAIFYIDKYVRSLKEYYRTEYPE